MHIVRILIIVGGKIGVGLIIVEEVVIQNLIKRRWENEEDFGLCMLWFRAFFFSCILSSTDY